MKMSLKFVAPAAVLAMVAACDNGPTGPTYPQIAGTYTSASFLTIRVADPVTGVTTNTEVCPGNVAIQQDKGTLTGTVVMNVPAGDRDCPFNGSLSQGAIDPNGAVTFGVTIAGGTGNVWTAVSECSFVSGASTFTGTITGNNLAASVAAVLRCGTTNFNVTLQMAGAR